MKVLLLVLALADWPVAKVQPSLLLLVREDGRCSAVAVTRTHALTATHCVEGRFVVADQIGTVVKIDEHVALVRVPEPTLRPLALGPPPTPGTEALAYGYGRGAPEPWAFPLVVSTPDQAAPEGDERFMFFSSNVLHGMSGGPVVDRRGRLVSLVIAGFTEDSPLYMIGLGARYPSLERLVKLAKESR